MTRVVALEGRSEACRARGFNPMVNVVSRSTVVEIEIVSLAHLWVVQVLLLSWPRWAALAVVFVTAVAAPGRGEGSLMGEHCFKRVGVRFVSLKFTLMMMIVASSYVGEEVVVIGRGVHLSGGTARAWLYN